MQIKKFDCQVLSLSKEGLSGGQSERETTPPNKNYLQPEQKLN